MTTDTTQESLRASGAKDMQLATFYVADVLLGVDINRVQEINRQLEMTPVPHAPRYVGGVINLRGQVVTVLNLRTILGLPEFELTRASRNLVIQADGELVGICVDRVSDIVSIRADEINPPPNNVAGVDGKFFSGVFVMPEEVLVILNVDEVLVDR